MAGSGGDDEQVRAEGYEVSGRLYVIFDPENPLAWVISDLYGIPPDRGESDDEEAGDG